MTSKIWEKGGQERDNFRGVQGCRSRIVWFDLIGWSRPKASLISSFGAPYSTQLNLFPNYLGSATWIMFRHSTLSSIIISVKPHHSKSFIISSQVNFGLSRPLALPSMWIASLFLTGAFAGLLCIILLETTENYSKFHVLHVSSLDWYI